MVGSCEKEMKMAKPAGVLTIRELLIGQGYKEGSEKYNKMYKLMEARLLKTKTPVGFTDPKTDEFTPLN